MLDPRKRWEQTWWKLRVCEFSKDLSKLFFFIIIQMAAFLDHKEEELWESEMLFHTFSTRGRCELILIEASHFTLLYVFIIYFNFHWLHFGTLSDCLQCRWAFHHILTLRVLQGHDTKLFLHTKLGVSHIYYIWCSLYCVISCFSVVNGNLEQTADYALFFQVVVVFCLSLRHRLLLLYLFVNKKYLSQFCLRGILLVI